MAAGLNRRFYCGVELTLEILQGKWKPVILAHLKEGAMRYGELRAAIPGLSDKMLSERLRDLEEQGLVSRYKVGRRGSPATYRLTQRGESLRALLGALDAWGFRIAPEVGAIVAYADVRTPPARRSTR
jgi:DNA-binding HxlR family transcriptional regulator